MVSIHQSELPDLDVFGPKPAMHIVEDAIVDHISKHIGRANDQELLNEMTRDCKAILLDYLPITHWDDADTDQLLILKAMLGPSILPEITVSGLQNNSIMVSVRF